MSKGMIDNKQTGLVGDVLKNSISKGSQICSCPIAKLKKAIKKETQFNKKVEYNVKVQQLAKKVSDLKSELDR
jgi:endonuclease III-like uncharacterized protein